MLPILQWLPPRRWAGIPLAFSLTLGACWTDLSGQTERLTGKEILSSPASEGSSVAQNPFPPIPTPPPPLPSPTGTPGVPPWWPRSRADDSPYAVLLSGFLQGVAAQGGALSQQGILLWTATGDVLAEHLLDQPLPVGALDQLAISLMALETWGYEHRFATRFLTNGRLVGERLVGDFIVVGSGDPYFTEANVQTLARYLRNYGIHQIDGDVKVLPSFRLLGQTDPLASGHRLVTLLQEGNSPIRVTGSVSAVEQVPMGTCTLVLYTSMRLGSLLQIMNGSNDRVMAQTLLAELGGMAALQDYLQQRLVASSPLHLDEAMALRAEDISLEQETQELVLSPRALANLWEQLSFATGGDPTTVLPMAGIGHSTLRVRTLPLGTSAQVGSTAERLMILGQLPDGTHFVLLNQAPDLGILRLQQDQFLQELLAVN